MENSKIELIFPYFFIFIFTFASISLKCPKNGSKFFVHRFTSKLPYNLILIWRIQKSKNLKNYGLWKFSWKSKKKYLTHFVSNDNSHKNLRIKNWPIFKDIFHLSRQKLKCKWKQFGKMCLIFEFSISKLGYTEIFMKIYGKQILTHFLGYFWVNIKMKMKIKNMGKWVRFLNLPYQN